MAFILFSLPHLTVVSPYMVPISLPIAQVALTMSVYMIIVLSLERYLVVSRPQKQVRISPEYKLLHLVHFVTFLINHSYHIFSFFNLPVIKGIYFLNHEFIHKSI